jgi:hypothetical protein
LIFEAIAGAILVVGILWEAFETVVLPRRVVRKFRFTVLIYRSSWTLWRSIANVFRQKKDRETFLSFFGPLSLLFLFAVWAAGIIIGFGLLYFSGSAKDATHPSFETCL